MKLLSIAVAAAAMACAAGAAEAQTSGGRQPGAFIGVGVGSFAFEAPLGDIYGSGGIELRGGYNVNKYLAVSAEALFPSQQYEGDGGRLYVSDVAKTKSVYGLFVEPRLPIGNVFGIYGRIGYVSASVKDVPTGSFGYYLRDQALNGLAFGGGVDVDLGKHVTIAFDLQMYDTDANEAGGAGLILKGRF